MSDLLYECAKSYKELEELEYSFKIFIDGQIKTITLSFSDFEFKHLSGIEKLEDLTNYTRMASKTMINSIYPNQKIFISDLQKSKLFLLPINGFSPNGISYTLTDRFVELQNLKLYFQGINQNMNSDTVEIFKWKRKESPQKRPQSSKISADYLIVFNQKNDNDKKINSEKTCSFFIEENKNMCVGVSIFPTDISYSNDGKIKLTQAKILSIEEHCKSEKEPHTLYECPDEERIKAEETAHNNDIKNYIKSDFERLIKARNNLYKKPDNEKYKETHNNRLQMFSKQGVYKEEHLLEVLKRLKDQAASPNNAKIKDLIEAEIEFIINEINLRREQALFSANENTYLFAKYTHYPDGTIMPEKIAEFEIPKFIIDFKNSVSRGIHKFKTSIINVSENLKSKISDKKVKHKPVPPKKPVHKAKKKVVSKKNIKKPEKASTQISEQEARISMKTTKENAKILNNQQSKSKSISNQKCKNNHEL